MSMMPVSKIEIPAKGRATLAPNGLHLMLFGMKSKLTEGGKVSITLKLDDGSTVPVTASVRSTQ
jgi:copper(I)-binding protein